MATKELAAAPKLPVLFGKAALTGFTRKGGELPSTEYTRQGVATDPQALAEYDHVCGFRLSDVLPATYPHMLTFPMAAKLMSDPGFPFPLVGLVHVRNVITVHRPLLIGDRLDLSVHAADLREHPKGKQFDLISQAFAGGELVWEDVSTYLRRGGGSGGAREPKREAAPAEPNAIWRVPEDIGRRYAAVSGDANPIHLHALTARTLGYRKAIAHGMWSKARCLAAFEGRLPGAYRVDVKFQLPMFLPAKVAFSEAPEDTGTRFALHDQRSGKPHLSGTVTPL
ncbi:MaoC/PaaZ C-terminal domain-containing protein [Sciscionella sediminilitoris]|uniref:MaoC/PaaZ C-terminal domain-containing protein n=1 Tax=Sciscionella sediminilitoris TaxID=1445613 RepID=UPI0004DF5D3D|nr:MaoC/PaaZ C-terminal domain-containing protein [Sciscionella sp. SE31]